MRSAFGYRPFMKSTIKQIVKRRCGGRRCQAALEWLVIRLESLMGIGAGARVETSGELAVLRQLRHSAATSLTILDVGANLGDFTAAALAIINSKQLVIHAFEPGRVPFAAMSARLAKCPNIHLNNSALSSQEGTAVLHYDFEGSGGASLTKRDCRHLASEQSKSESVIVTTLVEYCSRNNIDFIDLLKMDVEGYELEVLKGGA